MKCWLGVVHRDHVGRGVELGIAQIGHGKRGGLDRMKPGDWLVYYSPRISQKSAEPLQAFTAIGRIADDEVWQAEEGDFKPWRRRVDYVTEAHEVPVGSLKGRLQLTAQPNWGYQLRRGLIELSSEDLACVRDAMKGA